MSDAIPHPWCAHDIIERLELKRELEPQRAEWLDRGNSHLAVYRYDDVRATEAPSASIMKFLDSAYRAGAALAGWDIERLACPNGVSAIRSIDQS